ncbi:SigB/SigF/SigG family RNA polymerase sigma factor [Actinospica acidithermotolerans]|nr:SigB/SigF/SigG family RNA polymerase sigma factor [Actinospica acidithermotolerans]
MVTGAQPEISPPRPPLAAGHETQRAQTMRMLRLMVGLPAGDPERERLRALVVEEHMRYARRIARRYSTRGCTSEDFEQVAYLGLVKAVDNFDPEHGTGFLGYATPMIVGEIKRYFRDATWCVHVPRRMQELTGAMHKAADELTVRLGRPPTINELAADLGIPAEEVVEALDAAEAYSTASLDRPVARDGADGGATSLGETIGGEDPGYEQAVDHEVLRGLIDGLGERERRVLSMRYFRGMTQVEIGQRLGISQMQVSRLIARTLAKLRAGFG